MRRQMAGVILVLSGLLVQAADILLAQTSPVFDADCARVLTAIATRKLGEAPALPDSPIFLSKNPTKATYHVSFAPNVPDARQGCSIFKGHFQTGAPPSNVSTPVTVYVFVRPGGPLASKITVGNIKTDGSRTTVSLKAEQQTDKTKVAGVQIFDSKPADIDQYVVWLPSNEVVLCATSCTEMATREEQRLQKAKDNNARGLPVGADAPGTPLEAPKSEAGGAPAAPSGPPAASAPLAASAPVAPAKTTDPVIGTPAAEVRTFNPEAKIDLQIMDGTDRLNLPLEPRNCSFQGKPDNLDLRTILTYFFTKCVDVSVTSGYRFAKKAPEINLDGTPKVTIWVDSTKPQQVSRLSVTAHMKDGTPVTKECALSYQISNLAGADLLKGSLSNPSAPKTHHEFKANLDRPVGWRGSVLHIASVKDADCEPADAFKLPIALDHVTDTGTLGISNLALRSTLGEALIVLNTFTGIQPQDGGGSTDQLYPLKNLERYRDVANALISRVLQDLKGKVKEVKIIANNERGIYDKERDVSLASTEKIGAADIEKLVQLSPSNFDNKSMLAAVGKTEEKNQTKNKRPYKYRIFIGQSGLANDENYCTRFSPLESDRLYSFATIRNMTNPTLDNSLPGTTNFPARACSGRHVVLFPEARKFGWEEAIEVIIAPNAAP